MAEDDIYGNKGKFERFEAQVNSGEICKPGSERQKKHKCRYHCLNPKNLQYFKALISSYKANQKSYIGSLRNLQILKAISFHTESDLKDLSVTDVNNIAAELHKTNKSKESKDFVKKWKSVWKIIFPNNKKQQAKLEHLKAYGDVSTEKRTKIHEPSEHEKLLIYFSGDPCTQAVISLATESLGRPQELFYRTIGDIKNNTDSHCTIDVSSHGKEGTKFLWCIDSHYYFLRWLAVHPKRTDPKAWLFLNTKAEQLTPFLVNKRIRLACKKLGIEKRITLYTLKRYGVTLRHLRGESDSQIADVAGWKSTEQLKIYKKSIPSQTFEMELIRRGLKEATGQYAHIKAEIKKKCVYCNLQYPQTVLECEQCHRLLDRPKILEQVSAEKENGMAQIKQALMMIASNPHMAALLQEGLANGTQRIEKVLEEKKQQVKV